MCNAPAITRSYVDYSLVDDRDAGVPRCRGACARITNPGPRGSCNRIGTL